MKLATPQEDKWLTDMIGNLEQPAVTTACVVRALKLAGFRRVPKGSIAVFRCATDEMVRCSELTPKKVARQVWRAMCDASLREANS